MMRLLLYWTGLILYIAQSTGSWIARAPLREPRAGYAAGILDGRMIVAGGSLWLNDKKIQTAAVDAYDPKCDCWRELRPLPAALSDAAAVTLDDQLFVLGGTNGKRASRRVYSFDGRNWRLREDMKLPEPRLLGEAVTEGNRIFLMGGLSKTGDYTSGLKTIWSIDPRSPGSGWSPEPALPGPARVSLGAVVQDGKILVIGGYEADSAGNRNLDDIWSFDSTTHRWTRIGTLPEGRRAMAAVVVNRQVLLLGGFTTGFSADIVLLQRAGAVTVGELPEPVADAKFLQIGTRWYTTGGEVGFHARGTHTWSGKLLPAAEEIRP